MSSISQLELQKGENKRENQSFIVTDTQLNISLLDEWLEHSSPLGQVEVLEDVPTTAVTGLKVEVQEAFFLQRLFFSPRLIITCPFSMYYILPFQFTSIHISHGCSQPLGCLVPPSQFPPLPQSFLTLSCLVLFPFFSTFIFFILFPSWSKLFRKYFQSVLFLLASSPIIFIFQFSFFFWISDDRALQQRFKSSLQRSGRRGSQLLAFQQASGEGNNAHSLLPGGLGRSSRASARIATQPLFMALPASSSEASLYSGRQPPILEG